MIYTCTLNPSLDYYMEFAEDLNGSHTNRSQLEYFEAGGKGINVSIVLNNLMIPSRAVGFLGGFTKDFYINLLQRYEYIQPSFTYIEGHTRINVKAKTSTGDVDLNAAGPYIIDKSMEQLKNRLDRLDENDILVFSGNSPEYLLEQIEDMIRMCSENGVRIVLDTNPTIIQRCLKYNPYLINPSLLELSQIVNRDLTGVDEIIEAAKNCVRQGAKNVMVRLEADGSILANPEGVFKASHLGKETIHVNTVGTSDAMVAGFVMSSLRTPKPLECFKFANSCSEATVFSKSLEIRDKVNALYDQVQVEKLQDF
ncbi:Tagatose-6-phosphate kinase [bioreactor metagenome]|uniref:Tagatose-6-phosphate kinase n=1 Tax=bioreactor metagenome TaxID=1076179 RepID=A0A645EIP2_9ZZZZ|nr:1-phosphofructokinase family hexose kinase [Anaerorhabdus sp.]MEA4874325.1 1-phosphofructokinase family hexose kinase [Anaerorhabdus sp.]